MLRLLRASAVLLVAVALGGCLPGGEPPEPTAVLVAHPYPVFVDMPRPTTDPARVTITVTNIGHAPTGPLQRSLDFHFPPGTEGGLGLSAGCQGTTDLDPGESCTMEFHAASELPDGPYDVTITVAGEDSGRIEIPVYYV